MINEELNLSVGCVIVILAMVYAMSKFAEAAKVASEKMGKYAFVAFVGFHILALMSLYLSIVGSFIMLYMTIARYFQIIF